MDTAVKESLKRPAAKDADAEASICIDADTDDDDDAPLAAAGSLQTELSTSDSCAHACADAGGKRTKTNPDKPEDNAPVADIVKPVFRVACVGTATG